MDEIRKNQNVILERFNKNQIEGIIFDYTFDRVLIEIDEKYIQEAKKIFELEELTVSVDTDFGIKKMSSNVISNLNCENKILIENNPAYIVISKREFSRVKANIDFKITKDKKTYNATSINISGNGLAFECSEYNFKIHDEITIEIELEENQKITAKARIVTANKNITAAQYTNISVKEQDKIIKYVIKQGAAK